MTRNKLTRVLHILLLTIAVVVILYYGSGFLIPLAFGGLFAMLFYPLSQKLSSIGAPKWARIALSVVIFIGLVAGLGTLLFFQARSLVKDWPEISQQLDKQVSQMEDYLIKNIGIASQERITGLQQRLAEQSD